MNPQLHRLLIVCDLRTDDVDAVTRKSTELSDDTYTLRLDGSSHGRYFLSAGSPTGNEGVDNAESISVYSAVSGRVVASASEALKRIQVFTPMEIGRAHV